jgi:hypothetical protein
MIVDKIEILKYGVDNLIEFYYYMNRLFRNKWKWSFRDTEGLTLKQLSRVYNETIEDIQRQKNEINEDEFE